MSWHTITQAISKGMKHRTYPKFWNFKWRKFYMIMIHTWIKGIWIDHIEPNLKKISSRNSIISENILSGVSERIRKIKHDAEDQEINLEDEDRNKLIKIGRDKLEMFVAHLTAFVINISLALATALNTVIIIKISSPTLGQ